MTITNSSPTEKLRISLPKVLVEIGASASISSARRLIKQGAVELDGVVETSVIVDLPPANTVLKCGKRFWGKLIITRMTEEDRNESTQEGNIKN